MTAPLWIKDDKCPRCNHPAWSGKERKLGFVFDYMTFVAGPKIETVVKCNKCNGKYIIASEPIKDFPLYSIPLERK